MGRTLAGGRGGRAGRSARLLALAILLRPTGAALRAAESPDGADREPARARAERGPDAPRITLAWEGEAVPGGSITIRSEPGLGDDSRRRWAQVEGPRAEFVETGAGEIRLTVPDGARTLGFALAAADAAGLDVATVSIPIREAKPASGEGPPRADAGPDRTGLTGRPITLRPAGESTSPEAGVRWLQLAGPQAVTLDADGQGATFTPRLAGLYRFALLVAEGGRISEPDYLDVTVTPPPPPPPEQVAESALGAIEGGPALAEPLAVAFEAVADRMDLYGSCGDIYTELSRRLDAIIPNDPARRADWSGRLFGPLTGCLIEAMRPSGLDLGRPEAQAAPLNDEQKERLAAFYRASAEGFRAAIPPPGAPRTGQR